MTKQFLSFFTRFLRFYLKESHSTNSFVWIYFWSQWFIYFNHISLYTQALFYSMLGESSEHGALIIQWDDADSVVKKRRLVEILIWFHLRWRRPIVMSLFKLIYVMHGRWQWNEWEKVGCANDFMSFTKQLN